MTFKTKLTVADGGGNDLFRFSFLYRQFFPLLYQYRRGGDQ